MFVEGFRQAWNTIRHIEGWLPKPDAAFLFKAAREVEYKEGVLVEIGAYKGRSAVCMALATKSFIYSIDPFKPCTLGDGSVVPLCITDYLTNLNKIGARDRVMPLMMNSEQAREHWDREVNKSIKLLFIDGWHSYESVKQDYELWFPLVIPGGFIIFHDYSPEWPGVVKFVDELTDKNVAKFGTAAGFQKV